MASWRRSPGVSIRFPAEMTPLDAALERLEEALGHRFEDRSLLRRALIHRSYAAEQDLAESYERLEFLGDAVLQLAITNHLYIEYPDLAEGEMAKVRAAVVNERILARMARSLDLGSVLLLGRGEELSGGRDKDSILSDVVESVIGAMFLEIGFGAVQRLILERWQPHIDERAVDPGRRDYKTRLQEYLARRGERPVYEIEEDGPEHAKRFKARVLAGGTVVGEGSGSSKKRAEQDAAEHAVRALTAGTAAGDDA